MKYQVYAALIATTQAGPYADEVNGHMPTEADTKTAEDMVEKWLDDFEGIVEEAKPSVQARNRRIKRAYDSHEKKEMEIWEDGVDDLEKAEAEYQEEVMDAQMEFEHSVEEQGIKADWEKLVGEVQTEMDAAAKDMKKIRLSAKALKSKIRGTQSLSMSDEFHDEAPTPQEVEDAEAIIQEWFERGEGIVNDAKPGMEARDQRIKHAWEKAEKEEQEINEKMIDELMTAQAEFEAEVMEAEHNFEEELTQNGVVDDWKALEDKVEADMNAMKKFKSKVSLIKRRHQIAQRAQVKLNTNLAKMSDELAHNSPDAAEWDAAVTKMNDWMTRYEKIVEQVKPLEARRNSHIMDASEDRAEEVEDVVEEMFEDWDKNDQEFWGEVEAAEDEMLQKWETQGTTNKIEKLGKEIEDTFKAMEQGMLKIRSNMQMRKRIFTQSLATDVQHEIQADMEMVEGHKVSEDMDHIPKGEKVKKVWDTVAGWVKDAEAIDAKAEPAAQRREKALEDAFEDRNEEVMEIVMDADAAHKKKDEEFWTEVMDAQHDFEVRMEEEGIAERDRQLGKDIEAQFEKWGKMKRVGSSTSLASKKDELATLKSLKKLEAEIDSVLATL